MSALGAQLFILAVLVAIGLIGVAIARGVPAGSFVLGALLFVFGVVLAFIGFGAAIVAAVSILGRLLGAG